MIDDNDSQRSNACSPTDVTEDGMVIDARFLQAQKALLPINLRFDVIFTAFKLEHPLNVKFPNSYIHRMCTH